MYTLILHGFSPLLADFSSLCPLIAGSQSFKQLSSFNPPAGMITAVEY